MAEKRHRGGIDRMDHPLSHLSAVVGAVAFIVLFGAVVMWLSNSRVAYGSNWWIISLSAAFILTTSLIGYFRPYSQAIYVPLLLTGGVAIAHCVASIIMILKSDGTVLAARLVQSAFAIVGWLAWAARVTWLLRQGRQQLDDASRQSFRLE